MSGVSVMTTVLGGGWERLGTEVWREWTVDIKECGGEHRQIIQKLLGTIQIKDSRGFKYYLNLGTRTKLVSDSYYLRHFYTIFEFYLFIPKNLLVFLK